MYYTLNLRYVTPAQSVEALNRGFAVSHQYSSIGAPDTPTSSARVGDVVRVKLTVMLPADRNYVVVEDLLPAGLEPIDPNLKVVDPALKAQLEAERSAANRPEGLDYFAPWYRWYYNPWQHADMLDDRVRLTAESLPKGVYEFIYYARAPRPATSTSPQFTPKRATSRRCLVAATVGGSQSSPDCGLQMMAFVPARVFGRGEGNAALGSSL